MVEKLNILLLEDIADDAELINTELSEAGFLFSLKVVETEGDFLNALKSFAPDLILADYTLPSYDGLSALLSTREKYSDVPFIFVSGTIGEEKAIEAMLSGATDYVLKEKLSKLGTAVKRAIRERDERQKRLIAEESLMNSVRQWRATFDAIDDSVCLLSAEGKILRCNKAMVNFLGKPFAEIIGSTCWELIHRTEEPIAECPVLRMRETHQRETMLMHTGEKTLQVIADPILDEKGNLFQVVHIISDITECKRAEDALRESENKLRTIIEHSNELFYIHDKKHTLIYMSPTSVDILGYTPEEMMTKWTELATDNPINLEGIETTVKAIKTGEKQDPYLFELEKKDGTFVLLEIDESPINDEKGKVIGISGAARDVGDQKRAEERLQQSERRFRDLFNSITDLVYTQDLSGRFISVNPAMLKTFGYEKDEFIGKPASDFMKPEMRRLFNSEYLKTLKTLGYQEGIASYFSKDGHKIYIDYRSSLVQPENDDSFISGTGRDVTEHVLNERKIKELQEQMIQAQKMEAIGTLAGGVAHDFNNILTTIIGNANLALIEVGKDDTPRQEIEEIKKAGDRAASLVRQLLAFSRKQVIKPEVLDLNEVINETEKMLKRMIAEDIEFKTVLKPELWKVHMDSGQVDQILMNLAVNARDAMPQGGKLIIETANVDLDKNYLREHGIEGTPGHYVMLAISDTGSGMNKETQEHIFEPFYTTKKIGKGTGLGLSTVYGIVKQNNGFVWVYSEPGQGTTFKVYLPKVKEDVEAVEKERAPVVKLDGSETVLIVEDDDSLRKLARTVLKQRGYKVLMAENGEDALRVSEAHDGSIDLLITDVVMPKMGGKEIAERLQPLYPKIEVIYMSGYTDNTIVHHGVLEPGLNFLEKPFSPEGLVRKVREVLDK